MHRSRYTEPAVGGERRDAAAAQRPGFALVAVLLVAVVVIALTGGAALITSDMWLVNTYDQRQSLLESVADAGLDEARARLNGNPSLYPDTGYRVIENGQTVRDAAGNVIPGVTRTTYLGPIGAATGQFGVFGTIISLARNDGGDRVVRRLDILQESFARFAYFTDDEPDDIAFGGGDQIYGPVHTNDELKIYDTGATFHGPVSTAKTIQGRNYGTFREGYTEHAARIPLPPTSELSKLRQLALAGGTAFTGDSNGPDGTATTRIEFVAVDLNGDGDTTDADEGFIRVFQSQDAAWVTGHRPATGTTMQNSRNCGDWHDSPITGQPVFVTAAEHKSNPGPTDWPTHNWQASLRPPATACYLGGDEALFGGFQPTTSSPWPTGRWLQWTGPVAQRVRDARPADADYLFPISHALNPDFKGVIHVTGKVALSGVVRGRVTVAATDDIVIVDDITYATNPAAGTCDDLLGLFSGTDVVVAHNVMNAPVIPFGNTYRSFDDTTDEFIHAVILALQTFRVEEYDRGADNEEYCQGQRWGRGCLFLTGGIIQRTRGAVGTTGRTGYIKRYSYDACAFTNPPPYFPTTGRFYRSRYVNVDPTGWNVGEYFADLGR